VECPGGGKIWNIQIRQEPEMKERPQETPSSKKGKAFIQEIF
jgi:hypothetical protein